MADKPSIFASMGARGTGKSAWVKQQIERKKPKRLAVWDLMKEYKSIHSTENLGEFVRGLKAKTFAMAFFPSRDETAREAQFDLWCKAMLAAGNLVAVVEELAFVTKPNKAPPAWREMTLLGRHEEHRLTIYGTSQRPASIDKDFLANADLVHCGRLAYEPDANKAAMVLGVPAAELLRLPDLDYIERRAGDVEATRGKLFFGAGKPTLGKPPKGRNLTKPRGVSESETALTSSPRSPSREPI